jgi:hypothetical protein
MTSTSFLASSLRRHSHAPIECAPHSVDRSMGHAADSRGAGLVSPPPSPAHWRFPTWHASPWPRSRPERRETVTQNSGSCGVEHLSRAGTVGPVERLISQYQDLGRPVSCPDPAPRVMRALGTRQRRCSEPMTVRDPRIRQLRQANWPSSCHPSSADITPHCLGQPRLGSGHCGRRVI